MLLTEQDAEKKWCPLVRIGAYTDQGPIRATTVNRDPRRDVFMGCLCIASGCAMWRWFYPDTLLSGEPRGELRRGYCGLAGQPTLY